MTISMNGNDVSEAIQIAMGIGGFVAFVVMALIVYLLVRPPRRRRIEARLEPEEAIDAEELLALVDRMERRLAVLERAVAEAPKDGKQLLEAGEGPETRRVK